MEWIPEPLEVPLEGVESLLQRVVLGHVPEVFLSTLVEREQILALLNVGEDVVLLREHEVGIAGHGGAVSHEISHWKKKKGKNTNY